MKKIKGHKCSPSDPSNPSNPSDQIKYFEEKARPKSYYLGDLFFFQVHFLTQKNISKNNWTPTGYATHIPSGDLMFRNPKLQDE